MYRWRCVRMQVMDRTAGRMLPEDSQMLSIVHSGEKFHQPQIDLQKKDKLREFVKLSLI